MKKIFLFAIAAVGMTVGCQKIQDILVNPNEKPVDDNSPVEIKFTTNVANVETKATGPVTAFGATHTLYVYGLNTTSNIDPGVDKKEILNAPASAAAITGGYKLTLDKTYFYRGTTDTYDFYGYYVDDAATATPDDDYKLDVTINGQQDILLAKALGADAVIKKEVEGQPTTVEVDGAYSAKTARAGVHPNLEFQHQLAQFNFNVRNCGTYAVVLKGASLTAVNEGVLTVAGTNQGLVAGAATEELEVSTTEQTLAKVDKTATDNYTAVGVPVMVFPESEYSVVLYLYQDGMDASKVRKVTVPVTITNTTEVLGQLGLVTDPGALKGYAYDLNITVYSLEQITVTASLVAWKEGKSFEFDTEDNPGADEDEEDWNPTPAPATLTIDPTTKEVAFGGEKFNVTASKEATVTIPDGATWISCTPLAGTTFEFTVASNAKAEANGYVSVERTVDVEFKSGEETVKLTVTQAADPNPYE